MKHVKMGLSIVSLVSLFFIFTAPQGLAQDDGPVPWDCYQSTVNRSQTELPCYAHKQEEGLIAQHATAFPVEDGFVLQNYHPSHLDNGPVLQARDMPIGETRNRNAVLNKSTLIGFNSFRS